ncbi:MAG: hypothetical protein Q8L78_06770 [Coxiellaceae bacterium]|nr:hypothetical protein [Coxiellaceae bacterium]
MPFTYKTIPSGESEAEKNSREFREMRVRADYEDMIKAALAAIPVTKAGDFQTVVRDLEAILANELGKKPSFDSQLQESMESVYAIYMQTVYDTQKPVRYVESPDNDVEYQAIIKDQIQEKINEFNSFTSAQKYKYVKKQQATHDRAVKQKETMDAGESRREAHAKHVETEEAMHERWEREFRAEDDARRNQLREAEVAAVRNPPGENGFEFLIRQHQRLNDPNLFANIFSRLPEEQRQALADAFSRTQTTRDAAEETPRRPATPPPARSTADPQETIRRLINSSGLELDFETRAIFTGNAERVTQLVNMGISISALASFDFTKRMYLINHAETVMELNNAGIPAAQLATLDAERLWVYVYNHTDRIVELVNSGVHFNRLKDLTVAQLRIVCRATPAEVEAIFNSFQQNNQPSERPPSTGIAAMNIFTEQRRTSPDISLRIAGENTMRYLIHESDLVLDPARQALLINNSISVAPLINAGISLAALSTLDINRLTYLINHPNSTTNLIYAGISPAELISLDEDRLWAFIDNYSDPIVALMNRGVQFDCLKDLTVAQLGRICRMDPAEAETILNSFQQNRPNI